MQYSEAMNVAKYVDMRKLYTESIAVCPYYIF
jgi:hypothetical protein